MLAFFSHLVCYRVGRRRHEPLRDGLACDEDDWEREEAERIVPPQRGGSIDPVLEEPIGGLGAVHGSEEPREGECKREEGSSRSRRITDPSRLGSHRKGSSRRFSLASLRSAR